ncbi:MULTISPECIES: nucleoside kinase [Clostridium]|uniref:nucleoside kinase n=1 Tax=Clostridium TaxID=1485 RepID=UPI0012E4D960|nr:MULTISPECIES: nucleoside kinase [Clostridium]MBS4782732.1 nucleoside kinase [Clostridium sp.]CAG9714399.1 Putative uridine kinase [Clostridium neonatale]SUQ53360.1 Uridine kinase [Clostridium neonatale]
MINNNGVVLDKKKITFYESLEEKHREDIKEIAACKLDGNIYNLKDNIPNDGKIEIVKFDTDAGMKIYINTLQFIFIKCALDMFPNARITLQHSFSKSIYGEIYNEYDINEEDLKNIKLKMIELIKKDVPINTISVSKEEAIKIFENYNMLDKINLLKYSNINEVRLYELEGQYDYFCGKIAASTGVIKAFDVEKYLSGFILRRPDISDLNTIPKLKNQKSLNSIFIETERWLSILGIGEVGELNRKIDAGELQDIIMVSEALHEKKIANIADRIYDKKDIKIILIAGPSSSGKTTFANRLSIQLRVNGMIPIPLSLDNYFVNRIDTPKDESGEYDYENIDALDLKLLNYDLEQLMSGNEVELPIYNFKTGEKEWNGYKEQLPENGVLILEGIHGLNPKLIWDNLNKNVFKIYISALTQLNIDDHNRISTTDSRIVRRIVRDSLSRGYGAEETLKMWPAIKRGEKKNIFVYQEEADVIFNSTLVYELGVLKPFALEELSKVPKESPVYSEALRLITFLSFFKEINTNDVPKNSLLREFIGGSCFYEY